MSTVTRLPLAAGPAPLEEVPSLAAWAGVGRCFVQRDDLTGFALGGTVVRKLERAGAEAAARRADSLVTGGRPDDPQLLATALLASRLGLDCHLAVWAPATEPLPGSLLLARATGASVHLTGAAGHLEADWSVERQATRRAVAGGRPFAIPIGVATVNGALGPAAAVDGILRRLPAPPDVIVVAAATGTTLAGLLAATSGPGTTSVLGVDVGARPDLDDATGRLAALTATLLGRPAPADEDVLIDRSLVGRSTDAPVALAALAMARAGIVAGPMTPIALAALAAHARAGSVRADATVVLWHGDAMPAPDRARVAEMADRVGADALGAVTTEEVGVTPAV